MYRTVYPNTLVRNRGARTDRRGAGVPLHRLKETSTITFGPFVDDEACEKFGITVTVERTRTTITFADGDIWRHTELLVTSSANGKTFTERVQRVHRPRTRRSNG